tara:strand:- start:317 stop:466 length:150 start_codon:yes stop_codon:yes gene_type:complete
MVFLITTARLGPGEIAPEAQTKAKINIDWISNYFPFFIIVNFSGKGVKN